MALNDLAWYVNYGNGSTTGYYAVPVWPGALTPVTAGTWCRQLTAPAVGSERCFVAIAGGTTGAAEPVWVVTRGADTGADIDGTVTWQECTGVAATNGDTTNSPTWTTFKNTAVTLGAVLFDSGSSSLQICSTAGTAGNGSTPSFSATAGTSTTDNTVTWKSLGPTSNYTTAFKYPHARLANAFASTWGAAGNQFAVSSIHAETQSTAISVTSPGTQSAPCPVICISNSTTLASAALSTAATISTTGASSISLGGYAFIYGISFQTDSSSSTSSFNPCSNSTTTSIGYQSCTFNIRNTSSGSVVGLQGGNTGAIGFVQCYFYSCTFLFGATTQSITQQLSDVLMQGCVFATSGSVPTSLFKPSSTYSSVFLARACNFANITGTLVNLSGTTSIEKIMSFQNCKLGAAVTLVSGTTTNTSYVSFHDCDSTSTNYRYLYNTTYGTVQQETTIVRTGSLATDGTTPISWNFTTTATSSFYQPFTSEEISIWNDTTGSKVTITLYLISNTALNNNDFWAEAEYLGTSGFPLALTVDSRMTLLATPAALTSDSSTWGGSTNKYKIVLTCTPQNKGPIKVRFYAAKPSATTYVDPYIYLS